MVSMNCILSLSVDPNYLPFLNLILVTTNPLHFLQHAVIDWSYCFCSNCPLVWNLSAHDVQGSFHNFLQMANLCEMHHNLSSDCGHGSQSQNSWTSYVTLRKLRSLSVLWITITTSWAWWCKLNKFILQNPLP